MPIAGIAFVFVHQDCAQDRASDRVYIEQSERLGERHLTSRAAPELDQAFGGQPRAGKMGATGNFATQRPSLKLNAFCCTSPHIELVESAYRETVRKCPFYAGFLPTSSVENMRSPCRSMICLAFEIANAIASSRPWCVSARM